MDDDDETRLKQWLTLNDKPIAKKVINHSKLIQVNLDLIKLLKSNIG